MDSQTQRATHLTLQIFQSIIQAMAKKAWPGNMQLKTTQGNYALVVNDYVLPAACSIDNIKKLEPYLHMVAVLALMNALQHKPTKGVLVSIKTSGLNDLFYARASYKQNTFTVDIFQGYQRPFKGINLPPLSSRNDCINHSTRCMKNVLGSINGDLPFAQRFYDYTDDFVIITSYQNGNIICDIDPGFKHIYVDDCDKKGYYPLLLVKIGFINDCPPMVWDFSNYF